jgi:hypothetical protein
VHGNANGENASAFRGVGRVKGRMWGEFMPPQEGWLSHFHGPGCRVGFPIGSAIGRANSLPTLGASCCRTRQALKATKAPHERNDFVSFAALAPAFGGLRTGFVALDFKERSRGWHGATK